MTDVAKWEKQLERTIAEGGDPSKVMAAADKILALVPRHTYALRCRTVALLHQDRHAAALTALQQLSQNTNTNTDNNNNNNNNNNKEEGELGAVQEIAFQTAYCLYRAQRHLEARETLLKRGPITPEHAPSQHLLAQLHYHLEEYKAAASIYEALLNKGKFSDDHEKIELQTNYAAVCAAMDAKKTQGIVYTAEEKTADLLYNAATAQLEAQEYTAAIQTLQQAEILCARAHPKSRIRSFQDASSKNETELHSMLDIKGSPERSFFNDVAVIWVQMAYAYYATHQEEKATAILHIVLQNRPSSVVTLAVASINWAAIQRHRDFFDTHRKLKSAQNPNVSSRLTSRQRLLVRYNTAMLLLHTGNLNGFRRQVEIISKEYPDSDLTHSLKLALAVRESKKKRQSDDKTVTEYLKNYQQIVGEQKQNQSVGKLLPLIAAQIFFENGNLERAIESLSSAPEEIRSKPCTLVTLVTWKVQIGDIKGAKKLLMDTAKSPKEITIIKSILLWAIQFLATRGLYSDAVEVIKSFQSSVQTLQQDREAKALLALCLSHYDMQAARTCIETIPEAGFTGNFKNQKLSSSSLAEIESEQPSRQHIESLGYHRVTNDEDGVKMRRRRRRPMRRPPRNTETRIDPERWIPISQRSYVKDLPERRKRELKRLRAIEQEQKRHEAEKRKAAAVVR